jgi:hypothetical protein
MKKLLLLSTAVFAFAASVKAQSNFIVESTGSVTKHPAVDSQNTFAQSKAASANIVDTLWYFFNKHFYRNPASTGFFTLKNAPSYTSATSATQGGAIFKNSGSLAVTGAEGVVARQASSPSPSVNVGLFLYNVVAGVPSGAPIASLVTVVTGTAGTFVGGNFTPPVIVTGDYAILMQNVSTNPSDTLRLYINNALQASSTSTNNAAKYGEGLGCLRVGTSSFSLTTGLFSMGTDYEFLVAPRVAYSVTASASTQTNSPCLFTAYNYSNTSSPWIGHRQYNLNQFAVQWLPFANTASATIMPDPVYSWAWGDSSPLTTTNGTVTSVSKTYTVAGAYTASLIAKHQKMSDYSNVKTTDLATFSQTATACGSVGLFNTTGLESINIFPNPAISSIINITGLVGENVVKVYNILGQIAFDQIITNESVSINLSNYTVGSYFVMITNVNGFSKTIKVINQ